MKKNLIRGALALFILLLVGVMAAAFFLGSIVTKGVNRVAPTVTKVETKLDGASISLLSGKGELKGLFLGNPEGFKTASAIKVGSVSLALKASSILTDKIVVQSIQVIAPEITFEGSLSGNNLSKILEHIQLAAAALTGPTDSSKQSPAGGGKKIQVEDFAITGGKINLSMTILGGKSLTVPLPDIHLQNLGTDASGITPAELAEKIFKEITSSSTKAAADAVANLAKGATEAVKNIGKSPGATLEKTTKGLGDLFKKK